MTSNRCTSIRPPDKCPLSAPLECKHPPSLEDPVSQTLRVRFKTHLVLISEPVLRPCLGPQDRDLTGTTAGVQLRPGFRFDTDQTAPCDRSAGRGRVDICRNWQILLLLLLLRLLPFFFYGFRQTRRKAYGRPPQELFGYLQSSEDVLKRLCTVPESHRHTHTRTKFCTLGL